MVYNKYNGKECEIKTLESQTNISLGTLKKIISGNTGHMTLNALICMKLYSRRYSNVYILRNSLIKK